MHIPQSFNSLASLQTAGAASASSNAQTGQGALFSVDLTGGQDLQGDTAAAAGLGSTGGGLLAPSSLNLLIAQQADDSETDALPGALDPSQSQATGAMAQGDDSLRHHTMLS